MFRRAACGRGLGGGVSKTTQGRVYICNCITYTYVCMCLPAPSEQSASTATAQVPACAAQQKADGGIRGVQGWVGGGRGCKVGGEAA